MFGSFVKGLCCGVWSDNTASKTATKQRQNNSKTTLKMFVTLGIPYICDLLAWSLLWGYGRTSLKIFAITSILKVINALQGFLMFCVMYLDGSKMKTMYNKTMSYTTRSTFVTSSVMKNDVVTNRSGDQKMTKNLKAARELNIQENKKAGILKKVDSMRNAIELDEQVKVEVNISK